jgi:tyrosine-protein phosphatase SIW14
MPSFLTFMKMIALAALTLAATFYVAHADEPTAPIRNFGVAETGIYRGGAPDAEGLQYLNSLQVKTILDLEASRFWVIDSEKTAAERLGMAFVQYALYAMPFFLGDLQTDITNTDLNNLNDSEIDQKLALIDSSKAQGIYVHCMKGDDRTGLLIGLYQILYEKKPFEQVAADMCKYGYHPYFTALSNYFEKRTGRKVSDGCQNTSLNPFK